MRRMLALLVLALFALAAAQAVAGHDGKGKGKGEKGERGGDGRDGEGEPEREDGRGEDGGDDEDGEDDEGKEGDGGDEEDEDEGGERDDRRRKGRPRAEERRPAPAAPPIAVVLSGDAAVRQVARAAPGELHYVFVVGAVGPLPAEGVRMSAGLPDLGGAWTLGGLGSDGCALDGLRLDCSFGDLAPGELRVLQASGALAQPPPWQVRTTATVAAGNDRAAGNDASTTVVGVLLK